MEKWKWGVRKNFGIRDLYQHPENGKSWAADLVDIGPVEPDARVAAEYKDE